MNKKTAIIFDLDGTLIHSAPDMHAAMNVALSDMGRAPLTLDAVISFIGNGVELLVERSLRATGGFTPELHQETLRRFLAFYEVNSTTLTRPYPGVLALLDRLKRSAIPLGICTNKPTGPARDICDALGLTAYFNVIAGADAGQPKKPDPSPLLACCTALGVTPQQTIYLGDSAVDHLTALNANVKFGFYTGGYLNSPLSDPAPMLRFDRWDDDDLLVLCGADQEAPPL